MVIQPRWRKPAPVCARLTLRSRSENWRPEVAAKVLAALPFDLSVEVFDDPELEHHRYDIIKRMDAHSVGPLIDAMSGDQQADLFRELPDADRSRLLKLVDAQTRGAVKVLLRYPADTAGGLMTTEFVTIPTTWTVDEALRHIVAVGRAKETVYAIYVLDPADALGALAAFVVWGRLRKAPISPR